MRDHGSWKPRKSGTPSRTWSERENAGVKAVVEIGGQVGNLVGQIDQLRFERRKLVEEILGQFGMARPRSSRGSA